MTTQIKTSKTIYPQIYAYTLPTVPDKSGWIKIGYTERKDADQRIQEQVKTTNLEYNKLWTKPAFDTLGQTFKDGQLHSYLTRQKKIQKQQEWFYYNGNPEDSLAHFEEFANRQISQANQQLDYILRPEQERAITQTLDYIKENQGSKYLWNAKPRFGKTLATYDLITRLPQNKNILIVTNRPAIANSWYDDFEKFIAHKEDFAFVSSSDSLKDRPIISRQKFIDQLSNGKKKSINFLSLQDLKGGISFGGIYDKLDWVEKLKWDLLVIDEAHEGIDTIKTDIAFDKIDCNFTLHLSGTPFKAVAKGTFSQEQIFNWTYEDEQKAKLNYQGELENPYQNLPKLNLFSYQMSQIITDQVNQGQAINENTNIDYAFDLNEFFATKENGTFEHEADVKKWLDTLTTNEKYPFSTPELRAELKHTFWLLNRVDSAKALEKLLKNHPVFENYEIILAAGKGSEEEEAKNLSSLAKVKEAITKNDKTITLSVGQLTTGVTIPEWTAVLMLSNLKSPALYMQAAFRAQNPWEYELNGQIQQKENAYIFDFAPERTLIIYDEFANNLNQSTVNDKGTTSQHKDNIKELLNFFPVIAEDDDGKMVELDVTQVLTIPKKIKATEIVRRGFMSNLLFKNIGNIFSSQKAREILEKLNPVEQGKKVASKKESKIDTKVDQDNKVIINPEIVIKETAARFGDKVYIDKELEEAINDKFDNLSKHLKNSFIEQNQEAVKELAKEQGLTAKQGEKIVKEQAEVIAQIVEKEQAQNKIEVKKLELEEQKALETVEPANIQAIKDQFAAKKDQLQEEQKQAIAKTLTEEMPKVVENTVKTTIEKGQTKEKTIVEDDIRARLRGFTRTIPSFLMAYGDRNTRLDNFDILINDQVFTEVTGITLENFRDLRDEHQFFDEIAFDEACQEFLNKKEELANYFDPNQKEDIFGYIPPQATNQIYTPKTVVKMMIDKLELENPGIFADKNKTFIDLYTKSGLYLTEIIKRLYQGLSGQIPNENERLTHILKNQVFGLAPTEIIERIATRFVYGFDTSFGIDNIKLLDLTKLAKTGKTAEIKEILRKEFGLMKFDVVVGNPPYQINDEGGLRDDGNANASASPVYQHFVELAKEISSIQSLIIPAKWMSGAGKGLSEFTDNMMDDKSIKSISVYSNSKDVFPSVDIKGGVTYFVRDKSYNGDANITVHSVDGVENTKRPLKDTLAQVFIPFETLANILHKVYKKEDFANNNIQKIVSVRKPYGLSTDFLKYQAKYNLPNVSPARKAATDIKIVGLIDNNRVERYVPSDYPFEQMVSYSSRIKEEFENSLDKWKVFLPYANGSGSLGETFGTPVIGTPVIGTPNTISTETFLLIGRYDNELEASNLEKYIKSKFLRVLVGILKTTQHNTQQVWALVPLQNFTASSDIDWTVSIPEIDKQLYAKYGLDDKEIKFIEEKVKGME
jgi:hypothetical protein